MNDNAIVADVSGEIVQPTKLEPTVAPDYTGLPVHTFLSPEHRSDPLASKYANVQQMFDGLKNANSIIGRKIDGMVRIPGEGSNEKEVQEFREAFGVPKKVDGYDIPNLGNDLCIDEPTIKSLRKMAYDQGLNKKQFENIVVDYNKMQKNNLEKQVDLLRERYGARRDSSNNWIDTEQYDEAIRIAKKGASALPPQIQEEISSSIGTNPAITNLLSYIGRLFMEQGTPFSSGEHNYTTNVSQYRKQWDDLDRQYFELNSSGVSNDDPRIQSILRQKTTIQNLMT